MESDKKSSLARMYMRNMTSIYELVFGFFNDERQARVWLRTPNPMLGGVGPRDMVRMGRYARLLRFVTRAIEGGPPGDP